MSEVACLNGKHCVDSFLDLKMSYDSIDNVKLMQQACQLKWNPVVLYTSLLVHMSPRRVEDWRLVGRMDITVQLHSPRLRLVKLLVPELCCTSCCNTWTPRFPVQVGKQVDDINHQSQSTFFQALQWSVEATCMLDKGLTSLGLTLSQDKSVVVASHPQLLRTVRA